MRGETAMKVLYCLALVGLPKMPKGFGFGVRPVATRSWATLDAKRSRDEEAPDLPSIEPQTPAGTTSTPFSLVGQRIRSSPGRSVSFSLLMTLSGAALGPFLDSFHSAFGVLQYDNPITAQLWSGDATHPALITTWWVPPLFGLAGFLIGWLYILLDVVLVPEARTKSQRDKGDKGDMVSPRVPSNLHERNRQLHPSPPKILVGIAIFTFQYWLSGVLYDTNVDRTTILNVMSLSAAVGFWSLDNTVAGLVVSTATALGGPLIECALLTLSAQTELFAGAGYHYTDLGETGLFPLWIVPVYFLGGPANGNLARGYWNALGTVYNVTPDVETTANPRLEPCESCSDSRRVPCPNCDGIGTYVAMGGRVVSCTSCQSRGFVMCRDCFAQYSDDNDVATIRDIMSRMPD